MQGSPATGACIIDAQCKCILLCRRHWCIMAPRSNTCWTGLLAANQILLIGGHSSVNRRVVLYQARNALRRRGLEIGRTNPDCPPYTFLQLVIFPVLDINCVMDVGASQGEFGQHLRDFGYTGKIVSFEPVTSDYEILSERAQQDGDWFTHRYARGERDGTGEINVTRGSYWSSLLTPSRYGRMEFEEEIEVVGTEHVEIRRLDGFFDECIQNL